MSEAHNNQSLPYTSLNTTYMNLSKDFNHYITITLPETIFSYIWIGWSAKKGG